MRKLHDFDIVHFDTQFQIWQQLCPVEMETETAREKLGYFSMLTAGKHVPLSQKGMYLLDFNKKKEVLFGLPWSILNHQKWLGAVLHVRFFFSRSSLLFSSFILLQF